MKTSASKKRILSLIEGSDIRINGDRPWDLRVHDDRLYTRILRKGTLGLGEAYTDGWWDCDELDTMICKALRFGFEKKFQLNFPNIILSLSYLLRNMQSIRRSGIVAEKHYNLGNSLFEHMLGSTMNYSCAYWDGATTLDEAQTAKMELICRKLQLQEGMRVLDIGCGWGSLARYMARKYKVQVRGITVSTEQAAFARARSGDLPVEWLVQDYRETDGTYDRIVSVGMFEHVGQKNYRTYMQTARRLLHADGLFLLHTIGTNHKKTGVDPWIGKYIFPNGELPAIRSIADCTNDLFLMEDWHNLGANYDKTLMAWDERFMHGCGEHLMECSERTQRMFHYYLRTCAGAFRARNLQVWQVVLSPEGVPGGYRPVRPLSGGDDRRALLVDARPAREDPCPVPLGHAPMPTGVQPQNVRGAHM